MADFRPISCCNTIYKCIAKILANRLKAVLPPLINRAQSAFVKGRKISDNILLAQELLRNYHRASGPSRCALKIDLRKAFDTISWNSLFKILRQLQFPNTFIDWVHACISTAMFSIKINGSLAGYFGSTRGLRQGDPLSPYLFVLVMELLSMKLESGTKHQDFNFHWRTKDCQLTHLFFADDVLIFCHGSYQSVAIIHSCIHSFSLYSGLIPNVQKSHCFLANTDSSTTTRILSLLGFPLGQLPIKFLGVPLISTKLTYTDCKPLIHRLTSRVTSWTASVLAYSGRLQLIKSVLFSIQSFWCSHFMLPKAVLRSIQSILSRFLWKGPSLSKYGAKVSWSTISAPIAEGGLGIKNLLDWNKSLLILHLLSVLQFEPNSLWASWVQTTVLKKHNFWQIPIPSDCSWIWKQVLKLRPTALLHILYKVGRGDQISLWYDPWLHRNPILPSQSLLINSGLSPHAKVSDILQLASWHLPPSNHHDVILFRRLFNSLPAPPNTQDCILWNSIDIHRVKAVHIWDCIRQRRADVSWYKTLWHNLHVPRFSFVLWLGFLRKLPTNDITRHYTAGRISMCPLCLQHEESFDHLFFLCDYSRTVLTATLLIGEWDPLPMDWTGLTDFIISYQGRGLTKKILGLSLAASFYKIWEARNMKTHRDTLIPAQVLVKDVVNIVKARLSRSKSFIKATNFCSYYCNWLM